MRQSIVVLIAKGFSRHIVSGFAHAGAGNCCTPLHVLTKIEETVVTTVTLSQPSAQDLPVRERVPE
jgi:hypothetical protein